MWKKFTERARRIIFYAQDEAGRLGELYVSTEHILLGLTRDSDTVAARILDRCGVSLEKVRAETERQCGRGEATTGQDMQLTPRAKRVIDLSYDEARQLDNTYIGTEHLLLGLIREAEGLAGKVLNKLGVSLEQARGEVKRLQERNPPGADQEQSQTETTPPAVIEPRRVPGSSLWQATNAIHAYTFGMDTGNWPLAVSKFADIVDVDYSAVGGPRQTMTRAELEGFLQTLLGKPELRVHTALGQILPHPKDPAFVAYYSVRHYRGPLGQSAPFVVYGWYRFQMDHSLIASLTIDVSATEGNPSVLTAP